MPSIPKIKPKGITPSCKGNSSRNPVQNSVLAVSLIISHHHVSILTNRNLYLNNVYIHSVYTEGSIPLIEISNEEIRPNTACDLVSP